MTAAAPIAITPELLAAANAARVQGKHGPLPPVAFADLARTYREELPHQVDRLKWLASHDKMHWGTVAIRRKHLEQIAALLDAIAEVDPAGPVL